MATTRLIAMHQNKGKSIASCLAERIDYGIDPKKTNEGAYISAYECDPKTIQGEFLLSKRLYSDITGRSQESDVIAYQIRQSFKPGEITPELANKIGYELGLRFTKGNHAFLVTTHIDRAHIHNHIYFNSTSLDCTKKFRDFLGSGKAIRKISDTLCLQYGLSVIETPKFKSKHYGKWLGNKKAPSYSEKLMHTIDQVLETKPKDFEDFLDRMKRAGYERKKGKYLAFKSVEQKKFIRLRSLKEGYSEEEIREVLREGQRKIKKKVSTVKQDASINLLVNIQDKLKEGKGKGYERWAKVFNLKQMAQTINFLTENKLLSYTDLEKKVEQVTDTFHTLSQEIKLIEKKMSEITALKTHIVNYAKTRDLYIEYRKSGYAKKFYEQHAPELILYKAAKRAFDELNVKKLPTTKELQIEFSNLLTQKKKTYQVYRKAKKEMQEILTSKANIDRILGEDLFEKDRRKMQEK